MAFSRPLPLDMNQYMIELVETQFRKHNPSVDPVSKKARLWVQENIGIDAIWDINRCCFLPYRVVSDEKFDMFKVMHKMMV